MTAKTEAADWLAEIIVTGKLPVTLERSVRYASGFTLQVSKLGWYAVWESTDLIEGPFPTQEQAEACFIGEDDR